jgi:hypothetical protein
MSGVSAQEDLPFKVSGYQSTSSALPQSCHGDPLDGRSQEMNEREGGGGRGRERVKALLMSLFRNVCEQSEPLPGIHSNTPRKCGQTSISLFFLSLSLSLSLSLPPSSPALSLSLSRLSSVAADCVRGTHSLHLLGPEEHLLLPHHTADGPEEGGDHVGCGQPPWPCVPQPHEVHRCVRHVRSELRTFH